MSKKEVRKVRAEVLASELAEHCFCEESLRLWLSGKNPSETAQTQLARGIEEHRHWQEQEDLSLPSRAKRRRFWLWRLLRWLLGMHR